MAPEPIPLARVKDLLTDEASHRTLPRGGGRALQHAEQFARLTTEATDKLVAELRTLPYVDATVAVKVADTLPQYPEEIRLLFSKERVVLDEAQIAKLLEIVAQHR
jgi:DNA-directed RNA polymerase subunit F